MTDAEYEAQKARITALIDRWLYPMGLGYWKLTFQYERKGLRPTDNDAAQNWQPMMDVASKWQYLSADIRIGLPDIQDISDDDLENHFVHELSHVLVNEMREGEKGECSLHEERVCSMLANAFLWVRAAALKEAKGQEAS